ncbi:MAG: amino acid permease, partial [Candidatus Peribacteraceae bacterium]
SGGEAIYAQHAFGLPWLSSGIGLLVILSAVVSAGTLANAFVGYLQVFLDIGRTFAITITVMIAGFVAVWGIKESAGAASLFTLIEITGLLIIIWVGRSGLLSFPARVAEFVPSADLALWSGIVTGAFVAFYAFIGFEDMANIAEEVKNPHRNLPLGICFALGGATILYCLVAVVAVLSLSGAELTQTDAPLALIFQRNTGSDPVIITFISLFAIVNGLLVQIVMSSRILYGLSQRAWLPSFLGYVHPRTHTPLAATIVLTLIVLLLALWLPLMALAQVTSLVILVVFAIVNLSCVIIKVRKPHPRNVQTYPIIIPILGFCFIVIFLVSRAAVLLG